MRKHHLKPLGVVTWENNSGKQIQVWLEKSGREFREGSTHLQLAEPQIIPKLVWWGTNLNPINDQRKLGLDCTWSSWVWPAMSSEMEALPQQARTEPEERGLAQESGSHAGKPRSSLHCITFLLTSGHKLNGQCCKNKTIKIQRRIPFSPWSEARQFNWEDSCNSAMNSHLKSWNRKNVDFHSLKLTFYWVLTMC